MIDNDDINKLLQSLPQQQAPADLEPSVMRRIGDIRRRRWLFGVRHTTERTGWMGGAIVAALAGVLVAGGALLLQKEHETAAARRSTGTPRQQMLRTPSAPAPLARETANAANADGPAKPQASPTSRRARAHAHAVSTRRTAAAGSVRTTSALKTKPAVSGSRVMDTVAAARMRPTTPIALPGEGAIGGAGSAKDSSRPSDKTNGVGTGAR